MRAVGAYTPRRFVRVFLVTIGAMPVSRPTVERFLAQPGVDYPIVHPHLRLETTRPLAELVPDVLAWLDACEHDPGTQWKTS